MKTLKYLSIMLVMLACSMGFTSCSDDDDDDVVANSVVGTWVYTSADGASDTYIFKKDNSGTFIEVNADGKRTETPLNYNYNPETRALEVNLKISEGTQSTRNYTVTITSTTLTLSWGSYYKEYKKA